ncbi:NPCBM/NEW2 domain-containing protein [Nonomuraea polychroma]|uniref:NPCBM/NEW2 domain-containing protein n=1 Tax=Nonomuraea polychroma TaxID=46176 RepID=UPI003D928AA7
MYWKEKCEEHHPPSSVITVKTEAIMRKGALHIFPASIAAASIVINGYGGIIPPQPSSMARSSVLTQAYSRIADPTPQGETQFLSELTAVGGFPENAPAEVNGESYPNSVILIPNSSVQGRDVAEYDLSREWRTLEAVIGIKDDAPADATVRFEVFGDGDRLYQKDLTFGESEKINIDVSDVLRLQLQATPLSTDSVFDAVWGDALLAKYAATEPPEPTETQEPEPTETYEPEPTQEPEPTETQEPEPTETQEPEPTETYEPEPTES